MERAIRAADERLQRFRTEGPETPGRNRVNEERTFLEHEAARLLQIQPEWRLPSADPVPGKIEFTTESPSSSSVRARFLSPEPVDPALRTDVQLNPRRALDRARDFVSELDRCIQARPAEEARAQDFRFMLQGLGISELFTVSGYIAGSGEKEVDWKNLPTDVFMTALWGFINNKLVSGAPNLKMRWVRVVFLSETRSASDAVFYYFTPLKDTHGRDPYDATMDRWSYNASWNAATSPIPVAMYTLLTGLECVHGAKIARAAFGLRMAMSATTSFAYFRLRNHYVGENSSR
jgi:hypothetical protein